LPQSIRGRNKVERARQVVVKLEQDSDGFSSVLDVIKGIAEQTHLLALDAAIEAARAGEQGRGFAVVADKVRTLAARIQQPTAEIQQMIGRLQSRAKSAVHATEEGSQHAQAGLRQATLAGESLETITKAVSSLGDMNTQIASAAEEHSCAAEEINSNIANINELSDATAQAMRHVEGAGLQLTNVARQLSRLAGRFHT
jgi:methyl-accepting chemotaxis protein